MVWSAAETSESGIATTRSPSPTTGTSSAPTTSSMPRARAAATKSGAR